MTKDDVERYRTTLQALRMRLKGDVSHLTDEAIRARAESEGVSLSASPDVADQGSDSYEHDLSLSLLHNQEQTLEEIAEALGRDARALENAKGVGVGLALGNARVAQLRQDQADVGHGALRSGDSSSIS